MWGDIVNRVKELDSIDANNVVFGATHHNYNAAPPLTQARLNEYELKLKCDLPEQLRSYYLNVGNGGVGPDYGIYPIEKIIPYKPECEWQGVDYYREADGDYDEIASGMLCIMDRYYAHEGCIVTSATDAGKLIEFSPNEGWLFVGANDLISLFTSWLDNELESFNLLKRILCKTNRIEDLLEELNTLYGLDHRNTLTRLASMFGFPFQYSPDACEALVFDRVSDSQCSVSLTNAARQLFNDKVAKFLSIESNLNLSNTKKRFTHMKFLAIDVDYRDDNAHIAGVLFSDWGDNVKTFKSTMTGVEVYQSGEFYKRELPCILSLIKEHDLKPDCIFVDGYVTLNDSKPGLGWHVYQALNEKVMVIGVAKNPRGESMENLEVYRGDSKKPLYVTSQGIDLNKAKKIVEDMEGPYRIPKLIKLADTLCRQ